MKSVQVTLANGSTLNLPYVGPIKIDWNGRVSSLGAMLLGNPCLLGAIQMEDMDILVYPAKQMVIANPNHPNIPASVVY